MAISTYDELVTSIGKWLERDDLTSRIPDFIALAEGQLNRLLRVRQMETRATSTLDAGDEFFAVPNDFLEAKSFSLSDGSCKWDLDPQPDEVLEAATPTSGKPLKYALVGDSFHVYPTPDRNYPTRLVYYARLPALGPNQQTNWLLTKAPDAYLYGALAHAAPYLEDDTGAAGVFAQFFSAAISSLKAEQHPQVGLLGSDYFPSRPSFNIRTGS